MKTNNDKDIRKWFPCDNHRAKHALNQSHYFKNPSGSFQGGGGHT